jgi:hypothetical protein
MTSRAHALGLLLAAPPRLAALRLALGLLPLVAIGRQLVLHVQAGFSVLNFFSYFTNLSNLFAALVLLAGAFWAGTARAPSARQDLLRYASAVNMTIVGLVFAVLLRDVDLGALLPWVNTVVHYVMPIAVVLEWLLAPPATRLGVRQWLVCLIFPFAYLVYVLLRGAATGWYPYPFLDPARVGGHAGVVPYAIGIAVAFFVASWALAAPSRGMQRS